jgi:phage terminase small subunit
MRIRQMGFSSRLKAHRHLLTLETLKFISEFLVDGNAKQAALRSGIPETYASRQGQWLKKHPMVIAALERDLDAREIQQLRKIVADIDAKMELCKSLLGLDADTDSDPEVEVEADPDVDGEAE